MKGAWAGERQNLRCGLDRLVRQHAPGELEGWTRGQLLLAGSQPAARTTLASVHSFIHSSVSQQILLMPCSPPGAEDAVVSWREGWMMPSFLRAILFPETASSLTSGLRPGLLSQRCCRTSYSRGSELRKKQSPGSPGLSMPWPP